MKIPSTLPHLDVTTRQLAVDQQKVDQFKKQRQEQAQRQDAQRAEDAQAKTSRTQTKDDFKQHVVESREADQPSFYRFKDPKEFPHYTRQALDVYQTNQRSAQRYTEVEEIITGIDDYA